MRKVFQVVFIGLEVAEMLSIPAVVLGLLYFGFLGV